MIDLVIFIVGLAVGVAAATILFAYILWKKRKWSEKGECGFCGRDCCNCPGCIREHDGLRDICGSCTRQARKAIKTGIERS